MALLLLALLPFAPVLGLGLLRLPGGCCRSPARCLAGFSSLGWLAGCSPGSLPFCFEQLISIQGCLGFYASLLPGEGSCFLGLAWRYGRCFWRRPFLYPWCFPEAGSNVSVSTFLGWFAFLEVIVLKSRVSRFSWSLRFSRGALSSGFPIQWPPFRGWLSGSSVLCVGLAEHLPDIWPRASVSLLAFDLLLAWSLRLWGDPCLGVQWLSFRVLVLCPLLRRVDVALRDLPCSSVGGLHCPGPVNARLIAWENVFNLG